MTFRWSHKQFPAGTDHMTMRCSISVLIFLIHHIMCSADTLGQHVFWGFFGPSWKTLMIAFAFIYRHLCKERTQHFWSRILFLSLTLGSTQIRLVFLTHRRLWRLVLHRYRLTHARLFVHLSEVFFQNWSGSIPKTWKDNNALKLKKPTDHP